MNITVNREALVYALDLLVKIIPKAHMNIVFTGVEITAQNEHLMIRGCDESGGMIINIEAQIDEPGKIIVKHSTLMGLVKNFSDETVTLSVNENKLEVKEGKSKYLLGLYDTNSYISMPDIPEDGWNTIHESGDALRNCSIVFRMSESGSFMRTHQQVFYNVYCDGEHMMAVAPDATRLSVVSINTPQNIIIPSALVEHIKGSSTIDVADNERMVFIKTSNGLYYAIKTCNEYPAHTVLGLMNHNANTTITIERVAVIEAINRLRQICQTGTIKITDELITITSTYGGHKGVEEIPCQLEGAEQECHITLSYMSEALQACTSDTVKWQLDSRREGYPPTQYIYDNNKTHIFMSRLKDS